MKPRISVVTLGVKDLSKSRAFYLTGLGFTAAPGSNDDVTFIECDGLVLALWSRAALVEDAKVTDGAGFGGFSLAHNCPDRETVDRTLADAERAGAKILKPAHETFWGGYSGYFADPDGFAWEVAHNPFWKLDDGHVRLT